MNFKEYDEIIKNHKYDMLFFEIYYNLTCNPDFKLLTDEAKEKLIYFIYEAYLKDDNQIDLGYMCDIALEHKEDILKDDLDSFNTWDLISLCY